MPALARRAVEGLLNAPRAAPPPSQQAYLRKAMEALGTTMPELAQQIDVTARAMKNWLLPDTSPSHRRMPALARAAIEQLVADRATKKPRKRR